MKAKTELMLYQLSWTAGLIMVPTLSRGAETFEGWAHRKGLLRQIQKLEACALVESTESMQKPGKRVYRLSRMGRLKALGGVDPSEEWERSWDGQWRMALFDIPESSRKTRLHLRRALHALRFGCLQQSVWITQRPIKEINEKLGTLKVDARQLIFFEGSPCCGERPVDIVRTAWDFGRIATCWLNLEKQLRRAPKAKDSLFQEEILDWAKQEQALWKTCVSVDPFLPAVLLPKNYPGRKVWRKRVHILKSLGDIPLPPQLFP